MKFTVLFHMTLIFFSHILMFIKASSYYSLSIYLDYIYSDLSYITVNQSLAAQEKRRTSGLHVCMVHRKNKGGLDLLLALLPTGIVYRMVVGLGGTVVCRSWGGLTEEKYKIFNSQIMGTLSKDSSGDTVTKVMNIYITSMSMKI